SMIAVPALTLGAVYALGALGPQARMVVTAAALSTSLLAATLWGPLPFSRNEVVYWERSHPVAVSAREIVDAVPGDAVISVHHSLAPHMSRRREVYQFPNPFRVVLYEDVDIEGTRLVDRAERVEFVALPRARSEEETLDLARIEPAFELVIRNDYWELYRRAGPLPPP
ncbi:MAG: DUF2079 domain-containing protein, partial [Actinomycetota bacterium]|nr:DUF2079 domain-containing protein [Actinomycetota bacterium]